MCMCIVIMMHMLISAVKSDKAGEPYDDVAL